MELTLEQALQKGVAAHKAGNAQEANQYYTAILKANPKHPDANHNMGVLAVSIAKVEAALPYFKTALETNPSIAQFWLSYIDALIKLDRMDDAKAIFDQAKSKGAKGDGFDQIEKKFGSTTAKKSNDQEPSQKELQALINLYTQGHYQEALNQASQLLTKFPKSINVYNIVGAANQKLGKLDEAIKAYKKAILLKPDFADAYNSMGTVLRKKGKLDEAIKAYKKAILLKPDYAEAYNNMSNALRDQGKFEETIKACSKAISLKPDFAEAYNNMGVALRDQGKLDQAIEAYKKATLLKPDFAEIYNNIGNALRDQGKFEEAIEACKKAISLKPDFAEAFNNIGVALRDQGRLDQAVEAYKKATSFKTDFSDAYNNMGNLLKDQGKLDEAIEAFDAANSQNATAKALECLYTLENYTKFNERLSAIATTDPKNIRVAAISSFAAQQLEQEDIYPFCKNPLNMVSVNNIKSHLSDYKEYIRNLLNEMNELYATWEPSGKATKGGFQTNNMIFSQETANIKLLEDLIKKELELYKDNALPYKSALIQNWPDKIKLNAWYVRLLQGGHQDSHIHPAGWVSGVLYLKTITSPKKQEGAIKFGLRGYDYPVKNYNYPTMIHQPADGDLILFPSSLFHETIPVKQKVERCIIAFDLVGMS